MPDPVIAPEDFGAGIPLPVGNNGTPQVPAQEAQTNPWDQFRSQFEGVGDEFTPEAAAAFVFEKQREAHEYKAKLAEYEARTAAMAIQQPPAGAPAAPVVDEFKLPWEPVKVDPAFRGLVKFENGVFIATDKSSVPHIQAAEAMNRRQAYESQVLQSLWDDPAAFGEVLTKKQLAAMEKKFEDRLKAFETQFAPVQQHVTQMTAEATKNAFIAANEAKLFKEDASFTPLGEQVDWIMSTFNLPIDQAMQKAEARMAQLAPPSPPPQAPKPQTISKVAPSPKPARFVDKLSPATRFAVDKPDENVGNGRKRMTEADLERKYNLRQN